ncbi:acetyl-CoA hydrolase/transferase C-terminal domain-containing protein [Aquabacterium sp. CECT 9606]|uniref:acetyl-CoA hydrolase/transferase C-terminal domain-containing protein n=1 Tax=Aquabacterium sp. CECT 9606 TaxID=2845822 RepID=UPI001E3A951C|nr:acetyl-CoA hydrolase/transferase C-terminal domain-containing protein [Aquabacterium sp. CECT 9606]CAH0347868.1 butyrate:acetyl-CoA coenzyme A-transferase [Aquabacterium sp. CECT 9606]
MTGPAVMLDDVSQAVDDIIARIGKNLVVGLPLGLGKPVELVNALYARAVQDGSLQLKILTALSLEKPTGSSAIESAFLKPFVERVFGGVPELDVIAALRANRLPANVQVCEFFFRPGAFMDNAHAQQHYISSNYTHAARDVFNHGCNVVAQMICKRDTPEGTRYSLSCNPDTPPELVDMLRASGRPHLVVGVVNQNLPFMFNDAEVGPEAFHIVVDHARYTSPLFSNPKLGVTTPDHMIGLHASSLIKDGGTLQLGIGALGDAIVYAAQLRHAQNAEYLKVLGDCGILANSGTLIKDIGGTAPFEQGLYGATEMFVDGYLHLLRAGILKRRVHDFWALQQLVNEGRCDPEHLKPQVLDDLASLGVRVIRGADFKVLQHHGLFNDETCYDEGHIVAPDGTRVIANVADPQSRQVMAEQCLGQRLRNGIVLHGGFFLGPLDFYEGLRRMPEAQAREICMTGVSKINQLDRNPRLYRQQRVHARFMNTGILATLSGAVCSDGLEDLRVVSGVGGQYNFVAMAHELPTGRSILMVRAVRDKGKGGPSSNIVFNYGHTTIPRHLRDIVITEYGIADLRSRTDAEVIKALLNIADSRFQGGLMDAAKRAGKLEPGYQIPDAFQHNLPERLERQLAGFRPRQLFPAFPFGTDLTDEEVMLGKVLRAVKKRADTAPKWQLAWAALWPGAWRIPPSARPYLDWLALSEPRTLQDRVARALVVEELKAAGI